MSENDDKNFIKHPMEDLFDIEEGSTEFPITKAEARELVNYDDYDEKDNEIDEQFEEIYAHALAAYETQQEIIETIEGKFKGRNSEIAAQFLQIALNAVKEKSSHKMTKDKNTLASKKANGNTTNNNLFVGDFNQVLELLNKNKEDSGERVEKVVDGECLDDDIDSDEGSE